jgi:D-lactate dehydrogenase
MIGWFDLKDWEKGDLEETDLEIEKHEESLMEENCSGYDYDELCVFASSEVTAKVLEEIEPEAVFTRSTGFDHIDTEKAGELGIEVYNVPHYGSNTVAEHAFGLLLALSKRIPEAARRTHHEFSTEGLTGFELAGKKIGVIGTGEIGQEFIEMARGFDMDVIAYDPYGDDSLEEQLGFMYVSLKDMLKKSDIISLHCPLTDENRHMISEDKFARMNDTFLINTARGELIDSEALLEALEDGSVRYAGLDVLEMEDEMRSENRLDETTEFCSREVDINCRLIEREDTVVTPHNAFNTREAKQRILDTTLENIRERPEENLVV